MRGGGNLVTYDTLKRELMTRELTDQFISKYNHIRGSKVTTFDEFVNEYANGTKKISITELKGHLGYLRDTDDQLSKGDDLAQLILFLKKLYLFR